MKGAPPPLGISHEIKERAIIARRRRAEKNLGVYGAPTVPPHCPHAFLDTVRLSAGFAGSHPKPPPPYLRMTIADP